MHLRDLFQWLVAAAQGIVPGFIVSLTLALRDEILRITPSITAKVTWASTSKVVALTLLTDVLELRKAHLLGELTLET